MFLTQQLLLLWALAIHSKHFVIGWSSSSRSNRQHNPKLIQQNRGVDNENAATTLSDIVSSSTRRGFLQTGTAAALVAGVATSSMLIEGGDELVTGTRTTTAWAAASDKGVYKIEPGTLVDKTIVITGGTTGLGLESAKRLAVGGATVVLTGRTLEKGQKAVKEVQDYLASAGIENNNVLTIPLDLDNLENVKTFPERLEAAKLDKKIDVLMNNAGVMAVPQLELTKDGYERTFQSNHLGHFVLTAKLWNLLAKDARIINVSSEAYNLASNQDTQKQGLDLSNLNGEIKYDGWGAYGLSKLENILFTLELQKRMNEAGKDITVASLHPGAVNTDLARNFVGQEKWMEYKERGPANPLEKLYNSAIQSILKTVEDGASTQLFLAVESPNNIAGFGKELFYSDSKPKKLPSWAKDETMAKALWEKSEQLGGVEFKVE